MQFKTSLILAATALLGVSSSAAVVETPAAAVYPREVSIAAAANYWNFTIYDRANCVAMYDGDSQNYEGTTSYQAKCSPPSFFDYASVFIGATKGGKCRIAFYSAGGTSAGCSGLIGDPSAAKPGNCYNFNSQSGIPTTFNVTCT